MCEPHRDHGVSKDDLDFISGSESSVIVVSESEYHWLEARLAEPPRLIPALKELFESPRVFEI